MGKRANNEGAIRHRPDGRWEARYRDPQGSRRSVYGSSQAEVSEKLRDILHRIQKNEYCEPSRITTKVWMETWWREYCVPSTRRNSSSTTLRSIRRNIVPAIGEIPLQRLRTDHLQALINDLIKSGYAPATIRRINAALHSALKQAVVNHLIVRNPIEGVKLPTMQQKEVEVLTIVEQKRLIELLPDNSYGRALRFVLGTGLRASEVCGLRWLDIGGDSFMVNQAITTYLDYEEAEGARLKRSVAPPKSKAGKRRIPLTASIRNLLSIQWQAQRGDIATALGNGIGWPSDGLVFTTALGTSLDRGNLGRTLRNCLDKAGLRRVGVHALRHTFATNALHSGMDYRTLSELMGHASISFTLQVYAHTDMEIKRKAMEAMEANS